MEANDSDHSRTGAILVADIPYFDLLSKQNPKRAENLALELRAVLEDAVQEARGVVATRRASFLIAETEDVPGAIAAAWKARDTLAQAGSTEGDPIEARFVIHWGPVVWIDGSMTGQGVDEALAALPAVQPLQVIVSEAALDAAGIAHEEAAIGALGANRFFDPPRIENPRPVTALPQQPSPEPLPGPVDPTTLPAPERRRLAPIAIAFFLVVVTAIGGWMAYRRAANVAVPPSAVPPPVVSTPARAAGADTPIFVNVFQNETEDGSAASAAVRVRLTSIELLRCLPGVRIIDGDSAGQTFSARIRDLETGQRILVPMIGGRGGPPIALDPPEEAILAYTRWVASTAGISEDDIHLPAASGVRAFAELVTQLATQRKASPKLLASLRTLTGQYPEFVAAQRVALSIHVSRDDIPAAMVAGEAILRQDPGAIDVRRSVADWKLDRGLTKEGLAEHRRLLEHRPHDAETLELLAQFSLAADDEKRFRELLERIDPSRTSRRRVHEPDLLLYRGKIDQAVKLYYDIESEVRDNTALTLKIGRMAVLRHSLPIAAIELEKLQRLDPDYGRPMLDAYIAAELGRKADAHRLLDTALIAARRADLPWTSAAEVYALTSNTSGVFRSLDMVLKTSEPAAAYILNNPLFRFLENDGRFQRVRKELQAQQVSIRESLEGSSSIVLVDDSAGNPEENKQ